MDAKSHNLLESFWADRNPNSTNKYHYNSLMLDDGRTYRVDFTRDVTSAGIDLNIVSTQPSAAGADLAAISTVINELQGLPKSGYECQTLGWTYLGNITTNPGIGSQIAGKNFISLLYNAGYFVYGCVSTKEFYDRN
jgi:hypothetical protein